MHLTTQALVSLIVVASLTPAWGAAPGIGIATGRGGFRIDQASVAGNGTVLEGSVVETGPGPSEVRIKGGTDVLLGLDSRGRVFREKLILEQGTAVVSAPRPYGVEATGLRVLAAGNARARVSLTGPERLQVAALAGGLRVTNGAGLLLAEVPEGRALEFAVQAAGAAPPTTLTGKVVQSRGHYLLTDDTAGVTVELKGPNLAALVGKRVEVTGTLDTAAQAAEGATQVLAVGSTRVLSATAPAAAAAGMSLGTKAVIAGVVIAGAAAGTAIGLTRGNDAKQPISR